MPRYDTHEVRVQWLVNGKVVGEGWVSWAEISSLRRGSAVGQLAAARVTELERQHRKESPKC